MLLVDNYELYICHTYMHVLISCAKIMSGENIGDIIICDSIPDYTNLARKLRDTCMWRQVFIFEETRTTNTIYRVLRFKALRDSWILYKFIVSKAFPAKFQNYSDIFLYNDMLCAGKYLRSCNVRYHLIEDGIDYWNEVPNIKRFTKMNNRLHRSIYTYCSNTNNMIDFEVNDKSTIPKELNVSIIEKPKKELFCKLSRCQRDGICSLFIDVEYFEILSRKVDDAVLILTQPFWEDNSISNDECRKKYDLLSNLYIDEGYSVIIKPHPRDDNEYKCSYILNKTFPVEVLCFTPLIDKIKKVVSVNSTGGNMFQRINSSIVYEKIGLEKFYGN